MEGQILIFIGVVIVGHVSGLEIDHWGRHFVLSFIKTEFKNTVKNIVVITARESTEVRVVFHETGEEERFNVTSDNSYKVEYDGKVTPKLQYTRVSTKMAISVESLKPVSVYGYLYNPDKSEGFLVLPVASLGLQYMTVTYENLQIDDVLRGTQIVIIAVEDDTEITVRLQMDNFCFAGKDEWTNLDSEEKRSLKFRMDSYDVVNIMCQKDTTGSNIEANKPIAVLSGAKRIRLEKASKFHPIIEMLPPITEFGTEYRFVAPKGQTCRCMVRVVALHPDTKFEFKGIRYLTNSGNFSDIFVNQGEPVCFDATRPVIVALFMTGRNNWTYDYYYGNAFMSIIPPVSKFSKEYIVSASLNSYNKNFVNHVDIVHKKNLIIVENQHSVLCGDYLVTNFNYSRVLKIISSEAVLAVVYGYAFMDGYGFPAGMKLTDYSGKDECLSFPCQHGGWCLEVGSSFRCYCSDSRYTGDFCETELTEPDLNNSYDNTVEQSTTPNLPATITEKQCDLDSTIEMSTSLTTPTVSVQAEIPETEKTTTVEMLEQSTSDTPFTQQPPATTDRPSTQQPLVITDMPTTRQFSVITVMPSTQQTPPTTDTPSTQQPPVTTNSPFTQQPSVSTPQATVTTDTPAAQKPINSPSAQKPSVTTDTPSTQQQPVTTDTPSSQQPPVTTDTSSAQQPLVTSDTPFTQQPSVSTPQATVTTDTPAEQKPRDSPSAQKPPVAIDTPFTQQPLVTTDTPSTQQPSVTTDTPFTQQPPVTTDTPSTQQPPVTTDTPSAQQPLVTSDTPFTQQPSVTTDTPFTQLSTQWMLTTQTYASTGSSTDKYVSTYRPTNATVMYGSNLKSISHCKLPCLCSCPCKKSFNSSRALESTKELQETLKVDKTSLSKTFRKKNSSKNLKLVETEIGQSSFVIVMLPFACLVLSDLCKIMYWIIARRNRPRQNSRRL